jgi:glycosyltransferase involved in cell wall biosynthesis
MVGGTFPPHSGGVPRVIYDLASGLVDLGHDVDVLLTNDPRNEVVGGIRLVGHRPPFFFSHLNLASVRWAARNSVNYDLVHIHGASNPNMIVILSTCKHDRIVFTPYYHQRASVPIVNALRVPYMSMLRALRNKPKRWIALSGFEKSLLKTRFSLRDENIRTISPPMNPIFFRRQKGEIGLKQIHAEGITLLYVGLMQEHKNVHTVLDLVADLSQRGVSCRAVLVGYGPLRNQLGRLAHRLGINDKVEWLEKVKEDELVELYSMADFLIMPSSQEAYGMAVAEALLIGTPTLTSSCAALSEWDAVPGVIACGCPFDTHAATDRILSLLGKAVRVGPLGSKALSRVECAKEHEHLYTEVWGDGASTASANRSARGAR